jgi:hypothetical protein
MTDPVTPEIREAAHKAAWPPVPPEAVAAAESHALHGHVMWLLCASRDPEPSKITVDQRRQLIARLLELAAPAIRAEAAEAERERCIALAEQHKAHVWVLRQPVMPLGSRHMAEEPFADLLRAEHAGPDLIGGE